MKKLLTILLIITLSLGLVACATTPVASSAIQAGTVTLTDREGRNLTLPTEINSIISMSPAITQTLLHLGLGDKIVAVDTYSVGTAGLKADLPAFDMMNPDTEKMAVMKPDLILGTGMSTTGSTENPFQPLADLGIVMSYIPSSASIADIQEDIRFLGAATGTVKEAEAIITQMQTAIDAVVEKVKDADTSPRVYFEIAAAPDTYSMGSGTFITEMLTLMGATNVFTDQQGWVSVSEEAILAANPQVIFTTVDYIENPVEEIKSRAAWGAISAIASNQVFYIDTDKATLPNEYIALAMEDMAKALYPDLF